MPPSGAQFTDARRLDVLLKTPELAASKHEHERHLVGRCRCRQGGSPRLRSTQPCRPWWPGRSEHRRPRTRLRRTVQSACSLRLLLEMRARDRKFHRARSSTRGERAVRLRPPRGPARARRSGSPSRRGFRRLPRATGGRSAASHGSFAAPTATVIAITVRAQ